MPRGWMRGPPGGGFLIGRPTLRKPSARASVAPRAEGSNAKVHMPNQSVRRTNGSYALRTNFDFSHAAHCRRRRIGHFACRSFAWVSGPRRLVSTEVSSDTGRTGAALNGLAMI